MAAVLSIYLLGLALCLLTGIAVGGLLEPEGRWLGPQTLPFGLCGLMALLYPVGAVLPGSRAAPLVLALVLGLGVAAVWRLRRRQEGAGTTAVALRRALRPTGHGIVALCTSALAGALLLVPTMRQGFATTIAASNNDGWGYASLVVWMKDHSMLGSVTPDIARPLTLVPWSTLDNHFGFGFEHFATLLATILGRDGYEVVNSAAAVAMAAAVSGWAMLAAELDGRLGRLENAMLMFATASPLVALPFAENYTTQFVSICLWPAALAAFLRFSRRPALGTLILAGITTGGIAGVYPVLTPWLVLPLVAIAVLAPAQDEWRGTRLRGMAGTRVPERALRAVALLACLAVALLVLTPIQIDRTLTNLTRLSTVSAGGLNAFFSSGGYGALFAGATSSFSLFPMTPLGWSTYGGLAVAAAAYALALVPWRRPDGARGVLLAVTGGALLTTAVVFLRYRLLDELPYQVYKGMISGGAVCAGLILIGLLAAGSPASRVVRLMGAGALIAIWIPVTGQVLEASATGGTGFRAADVQMGRALKALPPSSVVLAEGAAPDARSFQFRMMAAYFGTRIPGVTTIGLGSTGSYLTPGGLPDWRPGIPWTDVLTTGPQPIANGRHVTWANAYYTLAAAPPQDVTTYGNGWYPPESDGTVVFAWTSSGAGLVLSNRAASPQEVRLEMTVESYSRKRLFSVRTTRGVARTRLAPDVLTPVDVDLTLPPRSTTPVTLDARPGATTAPPGDGRRLSIRVQGLRVTTR